MKRIISLALSCSICALCALPTRADAAVAVSASGALSIRSQYYDNAGFLDNDKDAVGAYSPFNTGSNLMLGLGLAVSPNLFAAITLRNLDPVWGNTDGTAVRSNGWIGSNEDLSGFFVGHLQYNTEKVQWKAGQFAPNRGSYTYGTSLVNTLPLAGVEASIKANDNVKVDLGYFRPYAATSDIFNGLAVVYGGAVDLLDISVPLDFDNFKFRPYASYMMIGENVNLANWGDTADMASFTTPTYLTDIASGVYGTAYTKGLTGSFGGSNFGKTDAYVAGFSALLNPVDNFNVTLDVHYGASTTADYVAPTALAPLGLGEDTANRAGFIIGASADYTMTFGTLTAVGWYGSGDDEDPTNGSERAVVFNSSAANSASKVAGPFAGDVLFDTDLNIISPTYPALVNMPGTAGLTVGLSNMNFASRLMHSVWANYTVGTNEAVSTIDAALALGSMPSYLSLTGNGYTSMTTNDSVIQFGLVNWYPFTQNLIGAVEAVYAISRFDETASQRTANPLMIDVRVNYLF